MLTTIAVRNYRSLRDLRVPLGQLTVVTGSNGSGKSNLYRALRLLADCAQGRVIASLAVEGGFESALWAGPEAFGGAVRRGERPVQGTARKGPVSLGLGFASDTFSYLIDLGLPVPSGSVFDRDPEIKRESVWVGDVWRPGAELVRRDRNAVLRRDPEGRSLVPVAGAVEPWESVLTEFVDPAATPEVLAVRGQVRSWRFYDQFRTDRDAPARQLQVGTRSPVLDHEGAQLAATVATIAEIGPWATFTSAVADAFGGARVVVSPEGGRFSLSVDGHGLLRPMAAAELSDGTLRYLLLAAALLSPRPPELMVLNEPETSLHPDLLAPLARLMVAAAESTQLLVVTHASALVAALEEAGEVLRLELVKELGETSIAGFGALDGPPWAWGSR